ncbi:MAG TPA: ATP-binding protein [Pyrinomonadaceae bacterium]|nr:ATP-binding protein [Pyrinomonadaceae bacterium]
MSVLSKMFLNEPRGEMATFKKGFSLRLVILFTALTVVLTAVVILAWEQVLKPPYYHWIERTYPGPANAENRDKLQQRSEHFFISMTVDLIVVSILLVIVDRKQRRLVEVNEQLAHNEKVATLGRVAAQVAHEVRNPLTGLLLYSEHLKTKIDGKLPSNDAQLIDKIIDTINNLTATTEQILNFARPVTLAPRRVDLNQVARDVVQLLSTEISAHSIETKLELDSSPVAGMLDEPSIRATTLNLVLNAVQAMPAGGRLTISTSKSSTELLMVIRDTGSGMSPDQIKQIFEPFNTTKSRGLGLGMPYAQKIIQQHGGKIVVESQPGKGTDVRIELPANERSH